MPVEVAVLVAHRLGQGGFNAVDYDRFAGWPIHVADFNEVPRRSRISRFGLLEDAEDNAEGQKGELVGLGAAKVVVSVVAHAVRA